MAVSLLAYAAVALYSPETLFVSVLLLDISVVRNEASSSMGGISVNFWSLHVY
jgi:hypothetical protein